MSDDFVAAFAKCESGAEWAAKARTEFAEISEQMIEAEAWTDQRSRIAERLAINRVQAMMMRPDALSEGPVSRTEKGTEFFNYRWAALRKIENEILSLEKSLALLPHQPRGPVPKNSQGGTAATKYLNRIGRAR